MQRKISKERLAASLFLVLVVTAVAAIVFRSIFEGGVPREPKLPPLAHGAQAPSFQLADMEGRPVSLEQFHGKPLLIMFWSSG
jgi:cytochrome oxidase Cu insertion factor (SCO1/SenC/PrrC family)